MKKFVQVVLLLGILSLVLSTTGCAKKGGSDKELVGFSVLSLTDPFIKMISDGVKDLYAKDGVEVLIASCEMSPDKQVEQLENFAAMGCKHILCFSMNSSGLESVITKLREKGITVLLIGANPPNYDVDGIINVRQEVVGGNVGKMAIKWLDQKYPDAAPGSIHTAVFTTTTIEDLKNRSEAIKKTISADPRVKIVFEKENVSEITEATAGMQEAFALDRDIKLVLAWNDALGIGCNSIAMSEKDVDKEGFAIFTSAVSDASVKLIEASKNNESVFRGTIKYGAEDVPGWIYGVSSKILKKEVELPYFVYDPIMSINSVGYEAYQE